MRKPSFSQAIQQIIEQDARYNEDAYHFLREALDYTIKLYAKPESGESRHVSGQELLEGIRKYAIQEFGPLAKTVLNRWGIHTTDDFGAIVFNLVEKGILGKNDKDSIEDFTNGYNFDEAFLHPFKPGYEDTDPAPQSESLNNESGGSES